MIEESRSSHQFGSSNPPTLRNDRRGLKNLCIPRRLRLAGNPPSIDRLIRRLEPGHAGNFWRQRCRRQIDRRQRFNGRSSRRRITVWRLKPCHAPDADRRWHKSERWSLFECESSPWQPLVRWVLPSDNKGACGSGRNIATDRGPITRITRSHRQRIICPSRSKSITCRIIACWT